LDHADLGIGEKMDCSLQQIWLRDEICIQNADKFTRR
jgi:hypothetical protein